MVRRSLFSLCLLLPWVAASQASSPPAPSADDRAYSLGASLGERLREEVPGLPLEALIKGLQQAYKGEPLALDDARIQQILAEQDAQAGISATPDVESALQAERRFMAAERARAGVREISDGILVSEQVAGSGAMPTANSKVQVRYRGTLPDGSIFDENAQPQWFALNSVIEGWRTALLQMKKGAKWRVVIGSAKAYGAEGAGDVIAPYTPLTFDIELLDIR